MTAAKLESFLIVNKMAPVEAWVRTDLHGKRRRFANWYEFMRWFDEKHHGVMQLPPLTNERFTDVLVDTLADSPRRRASSPASSPRPKAERAPGTSPSPGGKRNHGVLMDGKEFGSLFKAFSSLGWPDDSKFQRFRRDLKAKKELTLEGHSFKLIE